MSAEILDGIAAVVNTHVVTYSELRDVVGEKEKVLRNELTGGKLVNKIKEIRLAAINDLIDHYLLLQELRRLGHPARPGMTDQGIYEIIRGEYRSDRKTWLEKLRKKAYIKIY